MVNFRILHITDIHFGQNAMKGTWQSVKASFLGDLSYLCKAVGSIDIIALTGDVSNRGEPKEYAKADELIRELATMLEERTGVEPRLVCVPGNHDVQRNLVNKIERTALEVGWDEEIRNNIFTNSKDPCRRALAKAFTAYQSWVKKAPCAMVEVQNTGTLPGDFTATFEKDGVRLGLLGLNSAFRHVSDWAKEGSLSIPSLQVQAAAGDDLTRWSKSIDLGVLLTHHPTNWLADEQDFNDTVLFENSPIKIHLCGHLHEPKRGIKQIGGVQESFFHQGESLFGYELYPNGAVRLHGYAIIDVEATDAEWNVKIYPRTASQLAGGPWRFDRSTRFGLERGSDVSRAIDLGSNRAGAGAIPQNESQKTQPPESELAQWRHAYRMGEFCFPLALKISSGEYDHREVQEGLSISERFQVRSTLESAIRNAEKDPDVISWRIEQAVSFAGERAHLFFLIGRNLTPMRASGIESTMDDDRAQLVARIQEYSSRLGQLSLASDFIQAWANFATLWGRGVLTPEEIYALLTTFHIYFLLFGDESNGFSSFGAIVNNLAELDMDGTGRSADINQLLRLVTDLIQGVTGRADGRTWET